MQLEDQLKAQQSSSNCKASSSASSADNPGAAAIAAVAAAGAPVLAQELQQIRQACMELASMPANDASAAMEQVPVTAGGISQQQQQAVDDLMLELRRLKQVCACVHAYCRATVPLPTHACQACCNLVVHWRTWRFWMVFIHSRSWISFIGQFVYC